MINKQIKYHSQNSVAKFLIVIFSLLVGIVASVFAKLCRFSDMLFQSWYQHWHYLPLIVCPISFACLFMATNRFCKEAKGSGIPQTINALHAKHSEVTTKILNLRTIIGKIILTIGAFLSGASVGREGPTVLISAAIMYQLCKTRIAFFHTNIMRRGLIIAGGAAGISAAFSTPIAGIMFAIEELNKTFEARMTNLLTISIIMGGFVSIYLLNKPQYFPTSIGVLNLKDTIAVLFCAIICGIIGGLFTRGLIASVKKINQLSYKQRIALAFLSGLIIAAIGMALNGITYGSSYDEVSKMLVGNQSAKAPMFGLTKIFTIFITYLSGFSGGILAPTLAAGGGIGYLFHQLFINTSQSSLVIIGMISYFTGVVRSPLTCFVIVLEMTGRYDLCLPLMAATFIADMTSAVVSPKPIYEALAELQMKEYSK